MRAIEITKYGSTDVLRYNENADKPELGPMDILVHNKATSVNPIDTLKRGGYGWPIFEKKRQKKFPWIIGNDTSGVVVEVGAQVTKFNTGDEVFSAPDISRQGTWAEYTAICETDVALKPQNITFEEAASIPYVALTTWSALVDRAKLAPANAKGKKVLVHAGSGGIGTFAIQLLKSWGCFVATTCSSHNIDLVKNLGADKIIDYTKQDFSKVLEDYDVVFDTIGFKVLGHEEKSISVLKKSSNSVYVSIVHPLIPTITENGLLLGGIKVAGNYASKKLKNRNIQYHWAIFKPNGSALAEICQYIEAGKIKPVVDQIFPLHEMADAHQYVATGHASGKVVITI